MPPASPASPRHTRRARGALGAALVLLLTACQGASPADARTARSSDDAGDIVVAVVWPWHALRQVRYGDGLELAVEELNASGGIRGRNVRLRREDDSGSVDVGRLIAQHLANDPSVLAVIGHLQSYVTIPAASIYDEAEVLLISPAATDPALTGRGLRHVFRTTFTDKDVGRRMADVAAERGYKRVAIYYMRNTYGRGLSNAFEERAGNVGVNVIARQSYDPTDQVSEQTFASTLRDWQLLAPDALFIAGEVPSAGTLVAAIRKLGLTMPILGGDAMSSPELLATAGAAAEGAIIASAFHPDEPSPAVQRFVTAFRARFGATPDVGSALGYDAMRVLGHALRTAPTAGPADLVKTMHAVSNWPGVTGTVAFSPGGDRSTVSVVTTVVRNGQFQYLAPPAATGPKAAGATVAVRSPLNATPR
ncbi:MAG: ABC transporter substrate-binding protein [Gemmatimonadaceae bacterium]|nr:ABC transporter substrate-binding protein [Gemmatimonadaceae bacterium]